MCVCRSLGCIPCIDLLGCPSLLQVVLGCLGRDYEFIIFVWLFKSYRFLMFSNLFKFLLLNWIGSAWDRMSTVLATWGWEQSQVGILSFGVGCWGAVLMIWLDEFCGRIFLF